MATDDQLPTVLVVMQEWGVELPVWDRSPGRAGPVDRSLLEVPDRVTQALTRWAAELEGRPGGPEGFAWSDTAEEAGWIARGRALASELQRELGEGVEVRYAPQGQQLD